MCHLMSDEQCHAEGKVRLALALDTLLHGGALALHPQHGGIYAKIDVRHLHIHFLISCARLIVALSPCYNILGQSRRQ